MSDNRLHAIALLHATEAARATKLDQIRAQVVALSVCSAVFIVTFARSAERIEDATVLLIGLAVAAYLLSHRIGLSFTAHNAQAAALAALAAQLDADVAGAIDPPRDPADATAVLGHGQMWDVIAFGVPVVAALTLVI